MVSAEKRESELNLNPLLLTIVRTKPVPSTVRFVDESNGIFSIAELLRYIVVGYVASSRLLKL